jgi:hypothetical protein
MKVVTRGSLGGVMAQTLVETVTRIVTIEASASSFAEDEGADVDHFKQKRKKLTFEATGLASVWSYPQASSH